MPMIRMGIHSEPLCSVRRLIEVNGMLIERPLPDTASAVPRAMPSSSAGKAQMMSSVREITESTQPRR